MRLPHTSKPPVAKMSEFSQHYSDISCCSQQRYGTNVGPRVIWCYCNDLIKNLCIWENGTHRRNRLRWEQWPHMDPHPNLVLCPTGSAAQPRLSPCLQLWASDAPFALVIAGKSEIDVYRLKVSSKWLCSLFTIYKLGISSTSPLRRCHRNR